MGNTTEVFLAFKGGKCTQIKPIKKYSAEIKLALKHDGANVVEVKVKATAEVQNMISLLRRHREVQGLFNMS